MGKKYPSKAIIDIGANVGDTACMIASYANNDLVLVEASTQYFPLLEQNVRQLTNKVTLLNAFVSSGELVRGELRHGAGTASFQHDPLARERQTVRLRDVAGDSVCMVKTDTDGFDFRILSDAIEWLSESRTAILFEDYIANTADLNASNGLCEQLKHIGYEFFVVWDDAGRYLLSTTSLDVIRDLHGYLLELGQEKESPRGIWNYDLLCLHAQDSDVFEQVSNSARNRG
jgi:FkbM family methyltransferase